MRIGFLVGNKFQLAHFAELMSQFEEPDVIFFDRDITAFLDFDPQWLTKYGAYTRFIHEKDLSTLDGQYDAILAQINPPLETPWTRTKLIMCQYSMAKPKVAYGARFMTANGALVYGDYSAAVIEKMCPVISAGNARFDPFFEDRLDPDILAELRGRLDPSKKTLAFLPTWGDLDSQGLFEQTVDALAHDYNVLYKPHHITLRNRADVMNSQDGVVNVADLTHVLDIGPYLMKVTDLVVSEASGAIFDALYCRKPVVLLDVAVDMTRPHRKADPTALEIAQTHRIGPVVTEAEALKPAVDQMIQPENPFQAENEALVAEAFVQRGGCAPIAAQGLRDFLTHPQPRHDLQDYAVPGMRNMLFARAHKAAVARAERHIPGNYRTGPKGGGWDTGFARGVHRGRFRRIRKLAQRSFVRLPVSVLDQTAAVAERLNKRKLSRYLSHRAEEALGSRESGHTARATYNPHRTTLPRTTSGKIVRLKYLQDDDRFMDLGFQVEAWSDLPAADARRALYHFYCASSNIRFSRHKLRSLRARLEQGAEDAVLFTVGQRQELGKNLGLVTQTLQQRGEADDKARATHHAVQSLMGVPLRYLDTAATNDSRVLAAQEVITPAGDVVALEKATGPIFELSIMLGFSQRLGDRNTHTRQGMLALTRELIDGLHATGWSILPRLQAGYRGGVPVTGKYPCATWHTTHTQMASQIHLKVGSYGGYMVVDDRGYSGWSSLTRLSLDQIIADVDPAAAEAQYAVLYETLVARGHTKFEQRVEEDVPDVDRYIFFPMQLMTDTVAKLAHLDGFEVLETLIEWAQRTGTAVVVKRHPKCNIVAVARALEAAGAAGHIILSNAPIHALIAGADGVVTVNSGAGSEALLHLKPVITTGDSDYAAATRLVRTKDALLAALDDLPAPIVPEDKLKKFLWIFSKRYQLEPNDTEAVRARLKELLPPPQGQG